MTTLSARVDVVRDMVKDLMKYAANSESEIERDEASRINNALRFLNVTAKNLAFSQYEQLNEIYNDTDLFSDLKDLDSYSPERNLETRSTRTRTLDINDVPVKCVLCHEFNNKKFKLLLFIGDKKAEYVTAPRFETAQEAVAYAPVYAKNCFELYKKAQS